MKKMNTSYLAVWVGIPIAAAVIMVVLAFTVFRGNQTGFVISGIASVVIFVAIPMLLESRMKKMAASLEKDFEAQGFTYQYKFEANTAVYYIDQGGRMAFVSCYNPTELQFADLSKVTNVRVNDGRIGKATSRVCCEFLLDGEKVRITTLRVTRGTLSLKDNRVLEAISKADQLCGMLNAAKANARTDAC